MSIGNSGNFSSSADINYLIIVFPTKHKPQENQDLTAAEIESRQGVLVTENMFGDFAGDGEWVQGKFKFCVFSQTDKSVCMGCFSSLDDARNLIKALHDMARPK